MGFALFTFEGSFGPLQAALDWLVSAAKPQPRAAAAATPTVFRGAPTKPPRALRTPAQATGSPDERNQGSRRLRVVRVVHVHAPDSAERMVISGRMDDVCAELDRMAARQPTASLPRKAL